jgi:hypothetical protein
VSVKVLKLPQDSQKSKPRFANATFFYACFGVAEAFSITRPT